jgi:hypothetical protein
MPVDLTGLPIGDLTPIRYRFGRTQQPPTGGALTRIERMGSRWQFAVTTPFMPLEPLGRRWKALLDRAEDEGAVIALRPPGLQMMAAGSPVIASDTPIGRTIPVSGALAGHPFRQGQFVSFVTEDGRYADELLVQAIANADGEAELLILNLLRAPLTAGDVVEVSPAKAQGSIEITDHGSWSEDRKVRYSFTLTEDE